MTTQAQYDATGQILGTCGPTIITDADQIAALSAKGISLVEIPDGKSGSTGSIINGAYQDYPVVTPIPNLLVQLTAALINNGVIASTAIHPATLAQMNAILTPVSLAAVSTTATVAATPAL